MSATTPATNAPTWESAPAEYRRKLQIGAAVKAIIPALSFAALALALASGNQEVLAWVGPVGMVAMTLAKAAANTQASRAAALTLPSEHGVRYPQFLGSLVGTMSIGFHAAFAALCLWAHLPFATPFAVFISVTLVTSEAPALYRTKLIASRAAVGVAATVAVLAAIAVWAPESLATALAWTIGAPLVAVSILFVGDAFEDKLKSSELRPWAVRPYNALKNSKVAVAR